MSDGTAAGTSLVYGGSGDWFVGERFDWQSEGLDGRLWLAAGPRDGSHELVDNELWSSDGTTEGTIEAADVNPTGSSEPRDLVRLGEALLFTATDGEHGREPWRSTRSFAAVHPEPLGLGRGPLPAQPGVLCASCNARPLRHVGRCLDPNFGHARRLRCGSRPRLRAGPRHHGVLRAGDPPRRPRVGCDEHHPYRTIGSRQPGLSDSLDGRRRQAIVCGERCRPASGAS